MLDGYGDGYGDGDGSGYGYGSCSGSGYGSGSGDGAGYGYGDGLEAVGEAIGYTIKAAKTAFGVIASVGCEVGALDWWRDHWEEMRDKHGESVSAKQAARIFAMVEGSR